MRTILFIVLSISIAQISLAQQDTLIIKLDDYGQITIITDQLFNKKGKTPGFDKIYERFYSDFQKMNKSVLRDNSVLIRYIYDKNDSTIRSIKIEKNKNVEKEIYFNASLQQTVRSFNYTLYVKLSAYEEMLIGVNKISDFDKIAGLSIDSSYSTARINLLSRDLNKRNAYKVIYNQENNKINLNTVLIQKDKALDYINIYPSFGMSIVNSNFAPEIDINIDFALHYKSKTKYKFGINSSFLFIQDENDFFKVYTYNLAHLYYHFFVRDNSSHKFSVGYMYRKTGPHFNGDTWTAAWQYNKKQVGIKLGGYFTKNPEGKYVIIPSIGINFGF